MIVIATQGNAPYRPQREHRLSFGVKRINRIGHQRLDFIPQPNSAPMVACETLIAHQKVLGVPKAVIKGGITRKP